MVDYLFNCLLLSVRNYFNNRINILVKGYRICKPILCACDLLAVKWASLFAVSSKRHWVDFHSNCKQYLYYLLHINLQKYTKRWGGRSLKESLKNCFIWLVILFLKASVMYYIKLFLRFLALVVVMALPWLDMRKYMLVAHRLGMSEGDFAFLCIHGDVSIA